MASSRAITRPIRILLAVLVAISLGGCDPFMRDARQRAKGEFALLRQEPILDPPPGATELLRDEVGPHPMTGGTSIEIVYASPQSPEEVLRWYHQNHQARYGLSRPPINPQGEGLTSGISRIDNNVLVSVHFGPDLPDHLVTSKTPEPAPPGTQTYIEVSATYD